MAKLSRGIAHTARDRTLIPRGFLTQGVSEGAENGRFGDDPAQGPENREKSGQTSAPYIASERTVEQIEKAFTYHPPKEGQQERYNSLRWRAKMLAQHIVGDTPPSREQSLALTKLEEAAMWANAAIACNE